MRAAASPWLDWPVGEGDRAPVALGAGRFGQKLLPLSSQARTPVGATELWVVPREPRPRGFLTLQDMGPGPPEGGRQAHEEV